MKTSRRHLPAIFLCATLILSAAASGQETTDLLSKALDLVHQVENPTGAPPPDAQRVDLLVEAIKTAQAAPNHRLQGHRVLAIQAIRGAIAEIRNGDPDHKAATYLHTADTELSTSISLAGETSPPQAAPASPAPAGAPAPIPSATESPAVASSNPVGPAASACPYAILHNFGDGTVAQACENPCTALVQGPDGNLYGVTRSIDSNTSGNLTVNLPGKLATIYKMTPEGKVTILHAFDAGDSDNDPLPEYPLALGADGSFYGTITGGGSNKCGIIYKITSQGVFTPLHEFGDPSVKDDPRGPSAPLITGADGNFYGTSDFGGYAEQGAVFKMTPRGVVTTLHSFLDGSTAHDGDSPRAPVTLGPDGNYYGTTFNGSGITDKPDFKGTLFKITPGGKLTILHRFADGSVPNDGKASSKAGLFMARDKTLYGTTESGGTTNGSGTFFKFTTDGVITILHVFHGDVFDKDGVFPQPTLVEGPDGDFYGTTAAGGSANDGTIYKITPGGAVTILHNFGDGTVPNDGAKPGGGLILASDGCFYGTTKEGGSAGKGTAFRLKVP